MARVAARAIAFLVKGFTPCHEETDVVRGAHEKVERDLCASVEKLRSRCRDQDSDPVGGSRFSPLRSMLNRRSRYR
jgi:hypothetical protein